MIERDIRNEVFLEFYEKYKGEGQKKMEYACPRHLYNGNSFCTDFCEAVPILMEDNPSWACPCFAFGCEEAMERLQKYLAMEELI